MSKFVDKLRRISKSGSKPIGFRASASEPEHPPMLFVLGMSGAQSAAAKVVVDVGADAGLVLSENLGAASISELVASMSGIPVGVLAKGMGEEKIDELASAGCDFMVFDVKSSAVVLHKEKAGKVVMIEPLLDPVLIRAVNRLEVDAALINSKADAPFVAVEDLLLCRRLVELLDKPVIVGLSSLVSKAELTSLWEVGADGIVLPATYSVEALAGVKKMIGDLPRKARSRRTKADVVLPQYAGGVLAEADEDEDT